MNEKSYKKWYSMSDSAIVEAIGSFVQDSRLKKNLSQSEVAKRANISRSTLSLLERGETVALTSLLQVLRVLDLFHVLEPFEIKKQVSPIAIAKLERDQRKRASSRKKSSSEKSNDWEW